MKITDITAFARPLDLNYPTNKAIAVVSLVVFGASTILRLIAGSGIRGSAWWGFIASLAVFLAWALARELDPDHDISAFVATALAAIGLILFDPSHIILLLWILLVIRMINRTTGLPVRRTDSLLLLTLAGWQTFAGIVFVGLITALAFLLDSGLSKPQKHQVLFAGIQVLIVGGTVSMNGFPYSYDTISPTIAIGTAVLSLLFVVVIVDSRQIKAVGDQTGEALDSLRVQTAQILGLSTAVLITVESSAVDIIPIIPLWAAITGVSLYRIAIFATSAPRFRADG